MLQPGLDADRRTGPRLVELRAAELLFDLDGTLIDSIPAVEHAWRMWAAAESIAVPSGMAFHGRTAFDLVSSLVPAPRVGGALDRLTKLEERPAVPVPVMPGALELISAIAPGHWAIVTSAARPVALARLAAAGMPLPEVFVTGDDVTHGKPHPEPYLAGVRRATKATPAVAFEDTVAGLRSARAAGCLTVGIVGTSALDELLAHADVVIRSLVDVSVVSCDDRGVRLHACSVATRN